MANEFMSLVKDILDTDIGRFGTVALAVVGATAATFYLTKGPQPVTPLFDFDHQSIDIGGGVRISPIIRDKNDGKLMEYFFDDVRTTHEAFVHGLRVSGNGKFLGTRSGPNTDFTWLTYQQVYDQAQEFGSGLVHIGLKPHPDTFLGIYSINRSEWDITGLACSMYSMVTVPLYDTLGKQAVQYVINLAQLSHIVCDTAEKARLLVDQTPNTVSLKTVIVMEPLNSQLLEAARQQNIEIISFTDLRRIGRENLQDSVPPKPSDLMTICFTSGTTGNPKGAMLTHSNLVADVAGLQYLLNEACPIGPHDSYLSYLPLAHMYERVMHVFLCASGCRIGYFSGEVTLLFDDMQALRPTIFVTVPRLLNRIRDKIYVGAKSSWIKSFLLDLALDRKQREVQSGIIRRNGFWDKLVFNKLQNILGGQVKLCLTGSAPLSSETLDFVKCAFGCYVSSLLSVYI